MRGVSVMYFSNLLNESVFNKRDGRQGSMPFVCESSDLTVADAHVVCENEILTVKTGSDAAKKDLFMHGLDGNPEDLVVPNKQYKLGITYGDIQDTEENPLIVVLASSIKLYAGVTSYIKYITMDNCIMAMLVFGACEFKFPDGTCVPMQRCNSSNLTERQTIEYDCKSILGLSRLEDGESKYVITNDVVNAVVVSFSSSKGTSFDGVKYKTMKSHVKVFNSKNIQAARDKERKRKERAEQLRLKKINDRKEAERLQRLKKEKEQQEEIDKQFGGINQGALDFLRAVNSN